MKKNYRSCYLQPHIFYRIKREKMKKNDDAAIKCQHNSQLKTQHEMMEKRDEKRQKKILFSEKEYEEEEGKKERKTTTTTKSTYIKSTKERRIKENSCENKFRHHNAYMDTTTNCEKQTHKSTFLKQRQWQKRRREKAAKNQSESDKEVDIARADLTKCLKESKKKKK